jgi:hypothetical protein
MRATLIAVFGLAGCSLYFSPPRNSDGGSSSGSSGSGADGGEIVTTPKRMFVTSELYQGGLVGGLDGADAKCAARAASAGLGGMFKAWLSTSSASPKSRLTHSTAEYKLVDGTMVAASWDDLVNASIMHPIDLNENAQIYIGTQTCMTKVGAWTATNFDGTLVTFEGEDYTCGGWNSLYGNGAVGEIKQSDQQWTYSGCAAPCTDKAALYCIEQ